jgi:nucleoside 2-deoxyribosyltransferase
MRVFISSVRKGLEEERDALPGIIRAAGYTPIRFEDFSAQNEPSREACLKGMDNADVYLLILDPRYGHTFPDTGTANI